MGKRYSALEGGSGIAIMGWTHHFMVVHDILRSSKMRSLTHVVSPHPMLPSRHNIHRVVSPAWFAEW